VDAATAAATPPPKRQRGHKQSSILNHVKVETRKSWIAPSADVLGRAMAEVAAEAGWTFESFELPAVRRLFAVLSGGNITGQYTLNRALFFSLHRVMCFETSKVLYQASKNRRNEQ